MNVKKLVLTTAVISALGGLYGCSEGDDSTVDIDAPTTNTGGTDGGSGGGSNTGVSDCPAWASTLPKDAGGNDVCELPATILVDRTLTSDKIWFMDGTVTVGNGNELMSSVEGVLDSGDAVVSARLTIEAGTEIKGEQNSFANLIITRGSQINAVGTAANPIIFSSEDDGYEGAGEWGGLIIHGYGVHNECSTPGVACNVDAEGGGYEFSTGNEINGISFVGVGSGTQVDHIQVHDNADDGVEFYGGDVSAQYVVLTGNQDDSVDWDEGWQGDMQYVLVKQSSLSTGNAIEADTEGTLAFLSKPTIANATFIGDGSKTTLMVFKATSGGFLHHSVFTFAADPGSKTCVDSSAAAVSGSQLVFTTPVADCGTSGDTNLVPAPIADVQLDANYASQAAEASSVGALDISNINSTYAESEADPAFFDATTYAGAVDPTASAPFWFEGWTLQGTL